MILFNYIVMDILNPIDPLFISIPIMALLAAGLLISFFFFKKKIAELDNQIAQLSKQSESGFRAEVALLRKKIESITTKQEHVEIELESLSPPFSGQLEKRWQDQFAKWGKQPKTDSSSAKRNTTSSSNRSQQKKSTIPIEKKAITLFASVPDDDLIFREKNLSQSFNPKKFFYQVSYYEGDQTASYRVVDDANSQSRAIRQYNFILDKLCDYDGEIKPAIHKKIKTKSGHEGKLKKIAAGWKVEQKVVIEVS